MSDQAITTALHATVAPMRPAYADVQTAGAILGLGRRTIYDLLGTGELRAVKRGKSLLIDLDHALAYLAALPPARIKPPRKAPADQLTPAA